jgi:hypothetical protein
MLKNNKVMAPVLPVDLPAAAPAAVVEAVVVIKFK